MKFTEGYWISNERANALYAAQGYTVERITGGLRVTAPVRPITNRGMALDVATITIEFTACDQGMIRVKAWHFEAYDTHVPEFEKQEAVLEPKVFISEEEALMDTGLMQVRIKRMPFSFTFEADGQILSSCGYRNLGLMRWNRKIASMNPGPEYMAQDYEPYMLNELSLSVGECVYGFGERFTAFVKNGQTVETWNGDGGTASDIGYKCIPFYMTNKGYGIFVDSTDKVSFEVASEKVEYVGFSVPGEKLSYYFIYGPTPKDILKRYTSLTGRPALVPAWSFGLWLSTSFTTEYDEQAASSFIDGMKERDIPLSVFHFDCFWMKALHWCDFEWDETCFPDIEGMLRRYHEKGLKICAWINPYIAQGTDTFREGVKEGYFLKRADQKGVWQTDHWQPGMAVVDFTNPKAAEWYKGKLRRLLQNGVDCFKTDFGERIPTHVIYHDGSDPQAMHNYYTYLYNKTVFELLKEEKGEQEAVVFARSATAGSQKFPVHWGGDCSATYPSMAETIRGGLSFAMSGFSFWSHDISGFESTAEPDLYKRWAAFGLLSTHSRLHGSASYRVPWLFDEEACRVVSYFTKLKCRLMPYLYDKAIEAHEEGIPVMRPMVFEFTSDPGTRYLDTQYMLGESLMVAPILRSDGVSEFYLPQGIWTHLLSGKTVAGGTWNQEKYDYFSLPLYVRQNTLLAFGSNDARPDYEYKDFVSLRLYQLQDGAKAVCRIPDMAGRIVNTITAVRNGNAVTFYLEKTMQDVELTIYEKDRVKETVIKAGTTELRIEL